MRADQTRVERAVPELTRPLRFVVARESATGDPLQDVREAVHARTHSGTHIERSGVESVAIVQG